MKLATKREHIPNDFIAASRKRLFDPAAPHIHEFFEIEFVISGEGVCVVDGVEYNFKAGSIFVLSPINTHEIKSADAEIFNVMFSFGEESGEFLPSTIYNNRCPLIESSGEDMEFIYQLLRELVASYENDISGSRLLLSCLFKKLQRMGRGESFEPDGYVGRALLIISEGFKGGIALGDVARRLGLTPAYFSSIFKQQTGICFSEYLDNLRFSYAKNLLLFTDMPILQVAQKSGFEDYTNFSRRFKKQFGMTPSDFRRT